ncbi:SpoIVB peptidase S55 domain-containing protein [Plesiocystis pacifica]|nr:SpoIVB peptidase S55 domain-containing protein [Plesiocystis pacifica]
MAKPADSASPLRRTLSALVTPLMVAGVFGGLYAGFWAAGDAVAAKPGDDEERAAPAKRRRPGKRTGDPNIIPIDEIKRGMKGYALTVFHGETPDKFEIEVVDVVRDYATGQDAVLFTSPDPRLEHSGIVGGMSGSPIWIEGKLAGALAYGYRFSKDPLGGLTPIENMLEVSDLPYRPDVLPRPPRRGGAGGAYAPYAQGREGSDAWADQMLHLGTEPLPARQRPRDIPGPGGAPSGGLEPIGAPMSIAGLGPRAGQFLADMTGLLPVRGGGSHAAAASSGEAAGAGNKHTFSPGDSVSVVLIAGDNGAAPNGTVTWVGGKQSEKVLAFGHPMYGGGPSDLPIANAHVHTILNSVERSVKLSSALDLQGTMIQDRQPAIYLRTDIETPMIPVTTTVASPEEAFAARRYESAVANNQDLTAALVATLLIDAVEEAGNDAVELVLETRSLIKIETSKGPRTIELEEETYFPGGIIGGIMARSRALTLITIALDNQFEVAKILSVEQHATLHYGAPVERIERVRVADGELRAGELVELEVEFRPPQGRARTQTISLRIPEDAGGERVVVELAGGEWVLPYAPLPGDVDDLIDNVAATFPARSVIGTIYRANEGLATEHGLMADLPESVLQSLSPSGSNRKAVHFKQASRRIIRTDGIIQGRASLELDILPARAID